MIALTHFGTGNRIALNIDLIEKVEETPDTVITLVNGTRYLVQESLEEIVEQTAVARAKVLQLSHSLPEPGDGQKLRLLRGAASKGEGREDGSSEDGDDNGPRSNQQ